MKNLRNKVFDYFDYINISCQYRFELLSRYYDIKNWRFSIIREIYVSIPFFAKNDQSSLPEAEVCYTHGRRIKFWRGGLFSVLSTFNLKIGEENSTKQFKSNNNGQTRCCFGDSGILPFFVAISVSFAVKCPVFSQIFWIKHLRC